MKGHSEAGKAEEARLVSQDSPPLRGSEWLRHGITKQPPRLQAAVCFQLSLLALLLIVGGGGLVFLVALQALAEFADAGA